MTYNYRWTGSTITGAIAPLDHTSRNVKIHMNRFTAYAPRETLIMGVPWYGYDWPVTSTVPNATVRSDKTKYGAVKSVTYASARTFLAAHPEVARQYDAARGKRLLQLLGCLAQHVPAGVLRGRAERRREVRVRDHVGLCRGRNLDARQRPPATRRCEHALEVFYDPNHEVSPTANVRDIARLSGVVSATLDYRIQNGGDVPETGAIRWQARDPGRVGRSPRERSARRRSASARRERRRSRSCWAPQPSSPPAPGR